MVYKKGDGIKIQKNLKKIRQEEDVTYAELAKMTGTSQQNMHRLLNGDSFKLDFIAEVCEALGYELSLNILKKDRKNEIQSSIEIIEKMGDIIKGLNSIKDEEMEDIIHKD